MTHYSYKHELWSPELLQVPKRRFPPRSNPDVMCERKEDIMPWALNALVIRRKMAFGKGLELLLFHANPHLTLRTHYSTTDVTPRRFAHPRFTSTLLILLVSIIYSLPPHHCLPVLPRYTNLWSHSY